LFGCGHGWSAMWRIGSRNYPNLRQVEDAQDFLRRTQMTIVNGIESTAKNAEGLIHNKNNRQDFAEPERAGKNLESS
jgi:hypothetical protein